MFSFTYPIKMSALGTQHIPVGVLVDLGVDHRQLLCIFEHSIVEWDYDGCVEWTCHIPLEVCLGDIGMKETKTLKQGEGTLTGVQLTYEKYFCPREKLRALYDTEDGAVEDFPSKKTRKAIYEYVFPSIKKTKKNK